jgi:hypothetical protein
VTSDLMSIDVHSPMIFMSSLGNRFRSRTHLIRAGHSRLVLSIAPLPSAILSAPVLYNFLSQLTIINSGYKECRLGIILGQEI